MLGAIVGTIAACFIFAGILVCIGKIVDRKDGPKKPPTYDDTRSPWDF